MADAAKHNVTVNNSIGYDYLSILTTILFGALVVVCFYVANFDSRNEPEDEPNEQESRWYCRTWHNYHTRLLRDDNVRRETREISDVRADLRDKEEKLQQAEAKIEHQEEMIFGAVRDKNSAEETLEARTCAVAMFQDTVKSLEAVVRAGAQLLRSHPQPTRTTYNCNFKNCRYYLHIKWFRAKRMSRA